MLSFFSKQQWMFCADAVIGLALVGLLYGSFYRLSSHLQQYAPQDEVSSEQSALEGIDVSHYQGTVEWPVIAESFQFAFLKATEGNEYVDPRFQANVKGVQGTDLLFGAYHFFSPQTDALSQAQHFLDNTRMHRFSLPPVLDVEVAPDKNVEQFTDAVQQWMDEVKKSTGCTPVIYSNKSFWERYLKDHFSDYPVWISDYTSNEENIAAIPWTFWQFSDQVQVKGISGPVDQSRYRGSEEALKTLGSCQV